MMNSSGIPIITIDLVLDRLTIKDVLHGVLHMILFHRLFGNIKPTTYEVLDVTMPGVGDAEIEKLVDEKVEAFRRGVEGGSSKKGQILITLSERKSVKKWFSNFDEDTPWEKWIINAEVRQPKTDKDRSTFNSALAATLATALQTTVNYTSSEKGRAVVPAITDANKISPFPYEIMVQIGNVQVT
ncbi:autophagy-related protein [Panaeolus papilionaceus]|nr:autophagy-related protein [Panaeolus papilionaceus]